jgi:hypothetical protein
MDNEIYKQHDLFSYMYVCVDVVVHFTMSLVTMIHQELPTNCSFFSFICISSIGALFIHKSPWSCSFPRFWNSMTNI